MVRPISPFLKAGFEKFFDSHMQNYIGKLKMIKWNDLTQTVKINELFSPATLASQVLYKRTILISQCSGFFLETSLRVCVATSVSIRTNFKPDFISFPVHITSLSRLSKWLTILSQQLHMCPE